MPTALLSRQFPPPSCRLGREGPVNPGPRMPNQCSAHYCSINTALLAILSVSILILPSFSMTSWISRMSTILSEVLKHCLLCCVWADVAKDYRLAAVISLIATLCRASARLQQRITLQRGQTEIQIFYPPSQISFPSGIFWSSLRFFFLSACFAIRRTLSIQSRH